MRPTGIIFAALDCDADVIEEWNRWYDLEHVPPNVAMPGVMGGRRYVAPPELHRTRDCAPGSPFAQGRASFLTIYTLCGDPAAAFDDMTTLRDELYAGDRMRFPAEKKAVRLGDVLTFDWALGDPTGTLTPHEVPFLGHQALVVVERRRADDGWDRREWAPAVVGIEGVHGVASFESSTRDGTVLDLVYLEGDAASVVGAMRARAPRPPEAKVALEGAFLAIEPLSYPWAPAMRASDLPATVG